MSSFSLQRVVILVACLGFGSFSAFAGDIYYYEDSDGVLHMTDEPPTVKSYGVLKQKNENAIHFAARTIPKEELRKLIEEISPQHGFESALPEAVVKAESEYDTMAVSSKGARGLMQLMPETADALGVEDAHDPRQNLQGGIKYLRKLFDTYHGDIDLVAAAYNAGPGAVEKYKGVPPYRETIDYVKKVRKYYNEFKERASRSASTDAFQRPQELVP